MNLSWIDWTIMVVAVVALRLVSMSTRRYMKGVADFLSANRSAGRYLLTIAGQMGSVGAISVIATFEVYYRAGFPPIWWGLMGIPLAMILLLSGWVYYRFRETRALTMAQFMEMRYSRRFRIFAGMVCWSCGILNFGIFPAVAARFFVYFCGLPDHFMIPHIPWAWNTFLVVMALDLGLAMAFVTMGGQISVMVTECAQGMISAFVFIILAGTVLVKISWPHMVAALNTAPAQASMLHPFHTSNVKDFNIWFYLIGLFGAVYGANSWQGSSGFQSSGRSPHEQKMGGIIGLWRSVPLTLMMLVLPMAAYAIMHLPEYQSQANAVNAVLGTISNDSIKSQMIVPIALAHFLPIGVKGLFAMVMLFFSFTCHDTYMHSWGSIFIQDVLMPIRNKPLEPAQHIKWLRLSIIGVGVFAFIFSWLYPPGESIVMFFAITGTIWAGGSGAVIIGGLYWKKGTTAAAYSALILGAVVGVGGLIVPKYWKAWYGHEFPINGQWLWMLAMLGSLAIYFIVSLMTCRKGKEFNLDKMLRHGEYAVPDEGPKPAPPSKWMMVVGITKDFSLPDKILAIGLVIWNIVWFALFAIGTTLNLVSPAKFAGSWWPNFWHMYIWLYAAISVPATIWFTVGGVIDIKALLHALNTAVRDVTDDGRVISEPEESPIVEAVTGPEPEYEIGVPK